MSSGSDFARILARLVEASPGAIGAAFADEEGEAVDIAGERDPYELKLAAAHMGILINRLVALKSIKALGMLEEVRIRADDAQWVMRPLGQGYQVTVILEPTATLPKLETALDRAVVELRIEAGGVID